MDHQVHQALSSRQWHQEQGLFHPCPQFQQCPTLDMACQAMQARQTLSRRLWHIWHRWHQECQQELWEVWGKQELWEVWGKRSLRELRQRHLWCWSSKISRATASVSRWAQHATKVRNTSTRGTPQNLIWDLLSTTDTIIAVYRRCFCRKRRNTETAMKYLKERLALVSELVYLLWHLCSWFFRSCPDLLEE